MDLLVTHEFQGRGVGREMLNYVEEKSKQEGANLIRSEVGKGNIASQKLHEKSGFHTYKVLYENRIN